MADEPDTETQGGFRLLRLAGKPREEVELPTGPTSSCEISILETRGAATVGACGATVSLNRNGLPQVDKIKSEECEKVARGFENMLEGSRKYLGRRFTYDRKPLLGKKKKEA